MSQLRAVVRSSVPEVKLIEIVPKQTGAESVGLAEEHLLPRRSRHRGRPVQIQAPLDIRWPIVQEFLRCGNLSNNSKKLYERELKRFLGWTQCQWGELQTRHLGQYKQYLMELENESGRKLAKNSLNSALTGLKSFFRWLVETYPELCPANPTKGVKFERVPMPPAQSLTPEEVERVWGAIAQRGETRLRDLALVHLLNHNLRAGEVVAATVGAFDGRLVSIPETKTGQPRLVPLSPTGQVAVSDYLDWRREQGEDLKPEQPLILSHYRGWDGAGLSYHGIYFAIETIGEMAGLPELHPHQFRHTAATELLRKGLDPAHARRLTGHTDERSFRRYTLRSEQEAAIEAYYRAIEGKESKEKVYAKRLDRKQRKLLEAMAEISGLDIVGQEEFDAGEISFQELWYENLGQFEAMYAEIVGLPARMKVSLGE
jgi:integrase/recombinase XerD